MKKVLSLVIAMMLILPVTLLGACSKNEGANAVKNKIYYVTKVTSKGEDISKPYTDNNMKIVFYNNTFMVTYSVDGDKNYGYYLGTFTTSELDIIFTVTEAGGTYENYAQNPEKKVSVFSSLRYSNKKLYTEFAYNGGIYNFTLEEKSSK